MFKKRAFFTKTPLLIVLSLVFLSFLSSNEVFASSTVTFSLVILPPSEEVQKEIEKREAQAEEDERTFLDIANSKSLEDKDIAFDSIEKSSTEISGLIVENIVLEIPSINVAQTDSITNLQFSSVMELDSISGPSP